MFMMQIEKLNEKTGVAVPKPLVGIKDREVLHKHILIKQKLLILLNQKWKDFKE